MDGDQLTIAQVCALCGFSERIVKRALKREELVDLTPKSVGEWFRGLIEDNLSKHKFRPVDMISREQTRRKWY